MITPQNKAEKLAEILNLHTDIYLKREDLHPSGSHKGRSIPVMIEKYLTDGWRQFCISSSGNAALAAAMHIQEYNKKNATPLSLKIFVGNHIASEKLEPLKQLSTEDSHITVEQTETPKRSAFQLDKEGVCKNLRQSTDDTALVGYQTLAEELAQIPNLSAIFIPTSSGTTAQGLYEGFKKHNLNLQIHIIQTPRCHPFVDHAESGPSAAHAIVDSIGYRKNEMQKILLETKGKGWVATDSDIFKAQQLLRDTEGIEISTNSALSLAGLQLAIQHGWKFNGPVVCLITGR